MRQPTYDEQMKFDKLFLKHYFHIFLDGELRFEDMKNMWFMAEQMAIEDL